MMCYTLSADLEFFDNLANYDKIKVVSLDSMTGTV